MKLNTLLFSICLVFAVTLQTTAQKNTIDSLLTVELEEVEISTSAKTKIIDKIREPINRLNKIQFQKRFIEDRLFATLPNMDSWLIQCFGRLNEMAGKTHG